VGKRARSAADPMMVDLREAVKDLARSLFDPYRPELHYMRGPGPKWHAKHDRPPLDSYDALTAFVEPVKSANARTRSDAGTWNPPRKVERTQWEYGSKSPMHWWGSGMNALQNWRTEELCRGHHPSRSRAAAIGTDSNRARRCQPRSIRQHWEKRPSYARERINRLE